MTNEFAVIGHHRDEAETLLLLGADRHYYRYDLTDNRLEAVEPHEEWVLEPDTALLPSAGEYGRPAAWVP
jgi:hypothetical protein